MTNEQLPPTPEVDRLLAVSDDSQIIGEFIETSGYILCREVSCEDYHPESSACRQGSHLSPVPHNITNILSEYFDIDLDKVESERTQLLEHIRKSYK